MSTGALRGSPSKSKAGTRLGVVLVVLVPASIAGEPGAECRSPPSKSTKKLERVSVLGSAAVSRLPTFCAAAPGFRMSPDLLR
jgi:hypothetical protein